MQRMMHALAAAILYRVAARLPCRLIKLDGAPYLERYRLGSVLGCQAYLHRFVSADGDRHLHDHPWRTAVSLVLCGQYSEERTTLHADGRAEPVRLRKVRWLNVIRRHPQAGYCDLHRIDRVRPETWTLFIHGPWSLPWGFYQVEPAAAGAGAPQIHQYIQHCSMQQHQARERWWLTAAKGAFAGRAPLTEQEDAMRTPMPLKAVARALSVSVRDITQLLSDAGHIQRDPLTDQWRVTPTGERAGTVIERERSYAHPGVGHRLYAQVLVTAQGCRWLKNPELRRTA